MKRGAPGSFALRLKRGRAVTERTGATVMDPSVQDLRDQAERDEHVMRLGQDRWAHAYEGGRSTTIDSLLRDIDRSRPRPRLTLVDFCQANRGGTWRIEQELTARLTHAAPGLVRLIREYSRARGD